MGRTVEIAYTSKIEALKLQAVKGYEEKIAEDERRKSIEKEDYLRKISSCPVDYPEYHGMKRMKFDSLIVYQTSLGALCSSECGSEYCEKISIGGLRNLAANVAAFSGRLKA